MTDIRPLLERIRCWREDDAQGADVAIGLLCEAEGEIAILRAALKRYGGHDLICADDDGECTCGLAAALGGEALDD